MSLRVLVCPDKFKGTLSAEAVAKAIRLGLTAGSKAIKAPAPKFTILPLSDGGEGFVRTLVATTKGKLHPLRTLDALGRPCRATYGVLGDGQTAVVGLTEASALADVPADRRNPGQTTNAGTGRLLGEVLKGDFKTILVGIGGSATNEGGITLAAAALGYQFLDRTGAEIPLNGDGLALLDRIVPPKKLPRAGRVIVATDVTNPLFGPNGAARQFGKQKGASAEQIAQLDRNMRRLHQIVLRDLGLDLANEPGAGAAGGCGYGLMAFFRARQVSGFDVVERHLGLRQIIRDHDLVVTGEGSFDRTSLAGKAPSQVAQLSRAAKRPCLALCGRIDLAAKHLPFTAARAIVTGAVTSEQALTKPAETLAEAARLLVLERPELFAAR